MRLLSRFVNESILCLQEGILDNPVSASFNSISGHSHSLYIFCFTGWRWYWSCLWTGIPSFLGRWVISSFTFHLFTPMVTLWWSSSRSLPLRGHRRRRSFGVAHAEVPGSLRWILCSLPVATGSRQGQEQEIPHEVASSVAPPTYSSVFQAHEMSDQCKGDFSVEASSPGLIFVMIPMHDPLRLCLRLFA